MSPDLDELISIAGEQISDAEEADCERLSAFVARMMLQHPGMPREEAEQAFAFVCAADRDNR